MDGLIVRWQKLDFAAGDYCLLPVPIESVIFLTATFLKKKKNGTVLEYVTMAGRWRKHN